MTPGRVYKYPSAPPAPPLAPPRAAFSGVLLFAFIFAVFARGVRAVYVFTTPRPRARMAPKNTPHGMPKKHAENGPARTPGHPPRQQRRPESKKKKQPPGRLFWFIA